MLVADFKKRCSIYWLWITILSVAGSAESIAKERQDCQAGSWNIACVMVAVHLGISMN